MVRSLETRVAVAEAEAPARTRALLVAELTEPGSGHVNETKALASHLMRAGEIVSTTSSRSLLPLRIADMLITTHLLKNRIDVALVDVVSGRSFRWAEWVTNALRGAKVPALHVLRGASWTTFAQANSTRVRRLLAASEAVIAPSGYHYETLSAYGEIAEVIPSAIDASAYAFSPRTGVAPKMVWHSPFHADYNPQLGPRVLAELSRAAGTMNGGPEPRTPGPMTPHLTMLGADGSDGSLRDTLETARRHGVASFLDLPGPVSGTEVSARLAKGDVFLNTANVDLVPHSVLMAQACGLCVVSTDVGPARYLLRHGVDALLVPPDDATAMADAVQRLVADPALAETLSRNGRARAESLDWSKVLTKWRMVLHKGASRHGGTN